MEVVYNREKDRINMKLIDVKKSLVDLENLINEHIPEPKSQLENKNQKSPWLKRILNF